MTEIDGLDIHFIHVRSPHEDALPVIITHGWPGSVFELLKIVEPLTDPSARRLGRGRVPPRHPVAAGLRLLGAADRGRAGARSGSRRAWDELMHRLGYDEYVAQGGDWGAVITEAMGRQAPAGLRGIHVNLPAAVPADVEAALAGTGPVPEMTDEERAASSRRSAPTARAGSPATSSP